jgi:hypothetical protein
MKVICRRGIARLPMTTAASIAPIPPMARINPRSLAERPISSLTMNGSRTSAGPQKIR